MFSSRGTTFHDCQHGFEGGFGRSGSCHHVEGIKRCCETCRMVLDGLGHAVRRNRGYVCVSAGKCHVEIVVVVAKADAMRRKLIRRSEKVIGQIKATVHGKGSASQNWCEVPREHGII